MAWQALDQAAEARQLIQHSRFIAFAAPCTSEAAVQQFLAGVHAGFADARHIAHAWRLLTPDGVRERHHDAGEPTGTAGKPILQLLQGRELIDCAVAVVRYFGGVKLGTGGLVRAYSGTARLALEAAGWHEHIPRVSGRIVLDYAQQSPCERDIDRWGGTVTARDFGERVRLEVSLPAHELAALRERWNWVGE